MPATLMEQKDNTLTIQFTVELTGRMLEDEEALQQSLNEAGQVAMVPLLKQFDTHGEHPPDKRLGDQAWISRRPTVAPRTCLARGFGTRLTTEAGKTGP